MGDEHDVAIFAAGKRAKESGLAEDSNPYDPNFPHQNESWAAGWAEGEAPVPEPEVKADDATNIEPTGLANDPETEQTAGH